MQLFGPEALGLTFHDRFEEAHEVLARSRVNELTYIFVKRIPQFPAPHWHLIRGRVVVCNDGTPALDDFSQEVFYSYRQLQDQITEYYAAGYINVDEFQFQNAVMVYAQESAFRSGM